MRVIYVDDEADIREIVALAFSLTDGAEVETAASAMEGIERLKTGTFDIALFDVMMPEIDGPTALSLIRSDKALAGIPVVFVTARNQSHEVDQFQAVGARGVIGKPFDPLTLVDRIRAFLQP
ncbi:MAG: response regulator [Inquilinaceae bacterium]